MARDLSHQLRQFLVDALNEAGSSTQLAGARAYGPKEPLEKEWPFVRLDLPTVTPAFVGCSDAQDYTLRVHGFAKGLDEQAVSQLGNALVQDLDQLAGDLNAAPTAALQETVWTSTTYMRDTAETDGWHAALAIRCTVAG